MKELKFKEQFINNYSALEKFAIKLTKNKMDADDLIQETAIKAFRNYDRFKPGSSFKNWSFTILKNTFITNLNKRKKSNQISVPIEEVSYAIPQMPIEYSEKKDDQVINGIKKCINKLSDKSKKPFKMFINGYQYSEISDSLHIPIGTVKSRINFARTKLKTMITNEGLIAAA